MSSGFNIFTHKPSAMQKPIFFFIVLLCSVSSYAQQFTAKQLIEDLDFLQTELPKRHTNLFAKLPEEKFKQKISEIKQKAANLSLENFEIELYKLTKEIGDEHTRIEPPYKTIYPIGFDFFKEGLYVTKTDSAHAHLLYNEFKGIENYPIKTVLEQFRTTIQTENDSYFRIYFLRFVNNPDFLKGLNITSSLTNANFTIGSKSENLPATALKSYKPISDHTLLRTKKQDKYWYELIDNGQTLYFNYQDCAEQKDYPFEQFDGELFNIIAAQKPKKIIVDLRNNSGGNSGILQPFLDKLKDSYLNKKGSLFVLIGKETFSSALMNAVNLKRNFNSILVGESTSGNVNHYGETRGFYLPNTRIVIGYSTRYWETWKGHKGPLNPDVKIVYSVKAFMQHQDEALEYIHKQK